MATQEKTLDLDTLDFEVDYATDVADPVLSAGTLLSDHDDEKDDAPDILAAATAEAQIDVDATLADPPSITAPDDEEDVLVLEDNIVNYELLADEIDLNAEHETETEPEPEPKPQPEPETEPEPKSETNSDTDLEAGTDSEPESATKPKKREYLKAGLRKTFKIEKPKCKYTLSATTVESAICNFNKDLAHDFELAPCHHFNFADSGCNREPNSIHGNYLKVKMHICYDCWEIAGAIAFHRRNDPKCTFTIDG